MCNVNIKILTSFPRLQLPLGFKKRLSSLLQLPIGAAVLCVKAQPFHTARIHGFLGRSRAVKRHHAGRRGGVEALPQLARLGPGAEGSGGLAIPQTGHRAQGSDGREAEGGIGEGSGGFAVGPIRSGDFVSRMVQGSESVLWQTQTTNGRRIATQRGIALFIRRENVLDKKLVTRQEE